MNMRQSLVALGVCAAFAGTASAQEATYVVEPTHTFPTFEVSHLGFSTHRGRFNKTSGAIKIDMTAKKGSIDVAIDTASIDTGHDKLEAHLKAEDFFNVAKFPSMTFKGNQMRFDGDRLVAVTGDLTLLGVSKPVTLAVNAFKCGPNPLSKKETCGADVSTTIKRSDFGMKTYVPAIGDDVKIAIQIEALKQ
jgi:polyisoprenoid-binding protein YceI